MGPPPKMPEVDLEASRLVQLPRPRNKYTVSGSNNQVVQRRSIAKRPVKLTPAEEIKSWVASNKVMVFSKSWCPFCIKTKNLLK